MSARISIGTPKPARGSIDARLPRTGHDLRTFQRQKATRSNSDIG